MKNGYMRCVGNYNSEMRKKTTASVEAAHDHVNGNAVLEGEKTSCEQNIPRTNPHL